MNYTHMTESDKILHILDLLKATTIETGVTTEQLVDKGIQEGATKDIFTEGWHGHKEGDHPWWLLLAAMSGTGSEEEVAKYDVPYLHREKVTRVKNNRKSKVYVYWYDESYTHTKTFTGKAWKEKMQRIADRKKFLEEAKSAPKSKEEFFAQKEKDPNYINVDGKFILKSFFINHKEKAQSLYGIWLAMHPEVESALYGES